MKENDVELIQRILSGDDSAFSVLVQKHQKSVHALAWRKIGDFHIAEEITQDTFLQARKELASLKDPNRFVGWIYVIADRLCTAWFRKQKLIMQSLESVSEETLEKTAYENYVAEQQEEASAGHRREIVNYLLEMLPEGERTVIIMHYYGEMTCEKIGDVLGISSNTVKSRLSRARNRLRFVNIHTNPILNSRVGNDTIPKSNKGEVKGANNMKNISAQDSIQEKLPQGVKARLGKGKIQKLQYSPDGTILAVASSIGIWIYDMKTYKEISLLTEHLSQVCSIAFSPDGKTLASDDGTVLVWDIPYTVPK